MATHLKNLSEFNADELPSAKAMRIGIIVSEWNREITNSLLQGAVDTLMKQGAEKSNIIIVHVPGSFELTSGAKMLADIENVDGIICIGCVIRGVTPHFDYICQGVTQGITSLNLSYNMPFVFGVLTTDNIQQAKDRAGGIHGNKGDEAAVTVIKMISLNKKLKQI